LSLAAQEEAARGKLVVWRMPWRLVWAPGRCAPLPQHKSYQWLEQA
jgi:hypothetical protein